MLDVFDDVGKDDGISSSDDISDAEFSAGHSPRCTNTPDNRNSIYSTTSSVTASSFNSENVEVSQSMTLTDVNKATIIEFFIVCCRAVGLHVKLMELQHC